MNTVNYPKLFAPACNTRAVEYINEWIENTILWMQGVVEDFNSLDDWHSKHDDNIKDIPMIKAIVANLKKLQIDEDNTISLSELGAIEGLFDFDEGGSILRANIIPGEYFHGNSSTGEDYAPVDTLNENERLAIIDPQGNIRQFKSFSGNSSEYLSGNGNWQSIPAIENPTLYESIPWSALLGLKAAGNLVPGTWYKITDYETIVMFKGATSVNLKVDILILASDNDTLNENVYFIPKEWNDYLNAAKVQVWKGKYCIDNDILRFDFLNAYRSYIVTYDGCSYIRSYEDDTSNIYGQPMCAWKEIDDVFKCKEALEKNQSPNYIGNIIYTFSEDVYPEHEQNTSYTEGYNPSTGSTGYSDNNLIRDVEGNSYDKRIKSVYPVSKGAIYYLEDEYGNSAPYDFKSIIFTWYKDNGDIDVQGYTFSEFMNGRYDVSTEASVKNKMLVYRNTIQEFYTNFVDYQGMEYKRHSLNKVCFNSPCISNFYGTDVSDMYILGESKFNHFYGQANKNKFKSNVNCNIVYLNCADNYFELPLNYNIFKSNFKENSFTIAKHSNVQNMVDGKEVFPECTSNVFGQNFARNICTMPIVKNNTIHANVARNNFKATVDVFTDNAYNYPNTLYLENSKNLVDCVIYNNFQMNTVQGINKVSIGENCKSNLLYNLTNGNLGNSITQCQLKNTTGLILQGNNNNVLITGADNKNVTVEYGVSYITAKSTLVDANISRGVKGRSSKPLEINGTGKDPKQVTNYIAKVNEVYVELPQDAYYS